MLHSRRASVAMVKSAVRCAEPRQWLLTFLTLEHQRIFRVSVSAPSSKIDSVPSLSRIFLEAILLVARVKKNGLALCYSALARCLDYVRFKSDFWLNLDSSTLLP